MIMKRQVSQCSFSRGMHVSLDDHLYSAKMQKDSCFFFMLKSCTYNKLRQEASDREFSRQAGGWISAKYNFIFNYIWNSCISPYDTVTESRIPTQPKQTQTHADPQCGIYYMKDRRENCLTSARNMTTIKAVNVSTYFSFDDLII